MIYYRTFNLIRDTQIGRGGAGTAEDPYTHYERTQIVYVEIDVDSEADLPAMPFRNITTGYEQGTITYATGSKAHAIAESTDWQINSSGQWIQQTPAGLANVYTKAQTDALIAAVQADATAAQQLAAQIRDQLVVPLINTGGKNKCPVNSGSNTLPTRWLQISITLAPGSYKIYFGSITSTDTDAATCQVVCFDSNNAQASNYAYPARGSDIAADLNVTADTAYLRIYASDSYARSENDTVSVSDLMICTAADYAASNQYESYCPTLHELYDLVKSYHP